MELRKSETLAGFFELAHQAAAYQPGQRFDEKILRQVPVPFGRPDSH